MAAPTVIPRSIYYDGVVTETDRAKGRAGVPDFTVGGTDQITLSAHPTTPFALVVKKGTTSAFGVTAFVEAADGSNLVVQCDSNTTGTRWDLIVAHYDWQPASGGPSDLRVINAGGKQVPSTLAVTPGMVVDQPLWLVRWTGNASAPAEYVDLRCFAGNGGMMANSTLALDYLKKPGACVRVGQNLWVYKDAGNGQWAWESTSLLPARVDGVPAGQRPIIKTANVSVDTNAAGDFYITHTTAFPNAMVSYVVNDSTDPRFWQPLILKNLFIYSDRFRFGCRVYDHTGAVMKTKTGLFVSYTAIGY